MSTLAPSTRMTDAVTAYAGQTDFAANFLLPPQATDGSYPGIYVLRTRNGVEAWLETPASFSIVDLVPQPGGGSFFTARLLAGSQAGDVVRVIGKMVEARETAFQYGGALRTERAEEEFTRQGMALQELRRDVDQAVRAPYGTSGDAYKTQFAADVAQVAEDAAQVATDRGVAQAAKEAAEAAAQSIATGEAGGLATLDDSGQLSAEQVPTHLAELIDGNQGAIYVSQMTGANLNAKVQAAVALAAAVGGASVVFPDGVVEISQTIDVTTSNVRLIGRGGDQSHGGGTPFVQKTELKWTGAIGGTMIKLRTPYGPATQRRNGQALIGMDVNGDSRADIGMLIDSSAGGVLDDVQVRHCRVKQFATICGVTGTDGPAGEALDVQKWQWSRLFADTRNAAYEATTAVGYHMDGSTNANFSGNILSMCNGIYGNGALWKGVRADNNLFYKCSGFRAGASGATYTYDMDGAASGGVGCYGNVFVAPGWDATYGAIFRTCDTGFAATVRSNQIFQFDEANGAGPPVIESGAIVAWTSQQGVMKGQKFIGPFKINQPDASDAYGLIFEENGNVGVIWLQGHNLNFTGVGFTMTSVFQDANVLSVLGRYRVDGVQVLGPRATGWAADTGSQRRAANATYSSVAAVGYSQSQIQTLMDAVRDATQTIKALKDDLISHGIIGA